jgi:hypothetical protein
VIDLWLPEIEKLPEELVSKRKTISATEERSGASGGSWDSYST